ncbi:MAG: hypothetical protein PHD15_06600 [Clostridia bacterium]|nr:hypothetical protein [Clostridia bacterium]MDD4387400.1 hypothetical protein [Clostridia bacterium]
MYCSKNKLISRKTFLMLMMITVMMGTMLPTSVSASSIKNQPNVLTTSLQPQEAGLSGFGMSDHNTNGTFYIPVSGPTKTTGGITIKALNCSPNAVIIATIYRQDGSVLSLSVPNGLAYVNLIPGDSDYLNRYQFRNANAEVYHITFGSSEPVTILCWIYG